MGVPSRSADLIHLRLTRGSVHHTGDIMKAVRYDRFTGIDGIYLADLPEPVPGQGEVVVRVEPS